MHSLKTRLSQGLTVSLVALLSLQWLAVTYAIRSLTESQLIDRLAQESESLLAGTTFNAKNTLMIDTQRMGSVYEQPFSGHYFLVISASQHQISRSLWDANLNLKPLAQGEQMTLKLTGPLKKPLFVLLRGYKKQNHNLTIAIAEDITELESSITAFQIQYAILSIFGLLLLLIVQRMIVLKALKPLQGIQQSIAKLERGEADYIESQGPQEIQPLVEEFNRLLAGMDRKYQRSREALGNLAHALKTRLTLLNQSAEQSEIEQFPNVRNAIYDSTTAIGNIIERELKRARLLGDVKPGRRVDLQQSITELVETLRQIYAVKKVNISYQISTNESFIGDKEDLLEMLGNLLDNACKWCESQVLLTVTGGNALTFTIEDDGLGAASDALDTLTKRGFKADESKPGSGLGLAIVHDIVESYHGTLHFSKSDTLGGLQVDIRFNQTKNELPIVLKV